MNRKTNLLVVDGSRTTMRYIDSIFGGYCQIHLARTGIEAMDVVEIKPIDIIIMNRNLPDMDNTPSLVRLRTSVACNIML